MVIEKEVNDFGCLQVVEEVVWIVRRFNMLGKDKEDWQKKIIELCIDIVDIFDVK